ncbi:hypothetical protein [Gemmobacter serpentinus]|uniref:hypothetical protein n=1 Tax=Gemmobacter serpentinus TaxID=2652247 RepID=UPI00124E1A57|nr:hypothetical protein [Gemmobacter serpentinus]
MSLQNRVQPDGEIVAAGWRGEWMGNRGILHDGQRQLGSARWRHQNWICCKLDFKGRKRPLMAPGNYTELFFYDEAQALAAGHRPCAECRRADYLHFKSIWESLFGPADAKGIDRALHAARIDPGSKRQTAHRVHGHRARLHCANAAQLPQGTMILVDEQPALVWQTGIHLWSPLGYAAAQPLPAADVTVLTPAPIVAVLTAGYRPQPHISLR